jgi:glycosyltransferase involved in cell wall biosynthesis
MKVALVHDYLSEYGGAERVLEALSELYPAAPIYTAFALPGSTAWERFKDKEIIEWRHSWAIKHGKLYSPLRFLAPWIWESFDFSGYDLVISSASWYITKGIITHPGTVHICYCHTPPRYLYGFQTAIEWQRYWPIRVYARLVNGFLRRYDYLAAQRVDQFVANSQNVQARIKQFYGRDAQVIYPPVKVKEIERVTKHMKPQDYYLVVSRVVGAKGIDLAIGAANQLGIKLKIVGEPAGLRWEEKKFRQLQGRTVEFLGRVSDQELWQLYGQCKAFLALAQDEDFGITPVEAQAAGRPVIAFRGGGYLETVVEGKTGIFFDKPTVGSLVQAIRKIETEKGKVSAAVCRRQARRFAKKRFQREVLELVEKFVQNRSSASQEQANPIDENLP